MDYVQALSGSIEPCVYGSTGSLWSFLRTSGAGVQHFWVSPNAQHMVIALEKMGEWDVATSMTKPLFFKLLGLRKPCARG